MARRKAFDRDEVLEKAMLLFWEQGYEATSMQDLVTRMGVGRQSLYDTFGDKHTLYVEALEHYRYGVGQSATAPLNESGSVKERFARVFENVINEPDGGEKGCFVANATLELAARDPDVAGLVDENFCASVERFVQVLEQAQRSGELGGEKDLRALARFLFNTLQGLRVSAKATRQQENSEEVLRDIVRVSLSVFD